MKTNYKKIKNGLVVFLLSLVFIFTFVLSVNADTLVDNKGNEISFIGTSSNEAATYGVKEVAEEKTLEFGLKYHYDKAYVNTTLESDITADMNAAGGGAYKASGKMLANTYYPTDVRVFEIDPSLGLQVVPWVKFKDGKWTLNTVLTMAADYESSHPGYKVVGAINGDFFDINSLNNYNYTSTGGTVSDGNYYKVSDNWNSIGFKDGTLKGNITGTISEKPILEIMDETGKVLYSCDVDKINDEPTGDEVSVYMAFYDENHKAVPFDVTDAYVIDASILVPFSEKSIYGIGTFNSKVASVTINNKNYAIKTTNSTLINQLKNGLTVRVQYTYTGELADYDYVVGYPHNVLLDGACVAQADYRHPRTTIGVKADGTIVMAEIDGRQADINCYGCTLKEEAALMSYYGCVSAFNLDGGGSSTICLIQDGELTIQNSTSDGSARSDGNCLLIVAKVPILNVETEDVKTDSFSIKVDVEEMLETYKDLYIYSEADQEYKKIESGKKIAYKGLTKNTKYGYQVYAKIGNDYVLIPYSGIITTAKDKYELSNIIAKSAVDKNGDVIQISFDLKDIDETIITTVLIINGKRYYAKNGVFSIPYDVLSPFSSVASLQITYNINDLNGGITDQIVINAKLKDASIAFDTCIDEVSNMIDYLFK